jgi:AsmA protein
MRYLVIAVLGMMLLVTAAVFTLPHLAGGEFVTQQLQQAVARSTGRTLTLLKAPTVQVFPDAKVSVEGVSLSNPDGLFNGTTVSMERLDAKISLWQLLSRRADVQELTLVRPRLTLVIDKQGQVNWQLPQWGGQGGRQRNRAGRVACADRYRLRQCASSMAKSPSMTSARAPASRFRP